MSVRIAHLLFIRNNVKIICSCGIFKIIFANMVCNTVKQMSLIFNQLEKLFRTIRGSPSAMGRRRLTSSRPRPKPTELRYHFTISFFALLCCFALFSFFFFFFFFFLLFLTFFLFIVSLISFPLYCAGEVDADNCGVLRRERARGGQAAHHVHAHDHARRR